MQKQSWNLDIHDTFEGFMLPEYTSFYIIKEKTAKACITGWIPMVQRKSLIHWTRNHFSRNTSAFWHSQQTHSVFAGNRSFNCFPWHGPRLLWIIYCTQCKHKCKRLVLFWGGVRCFWLIACKESILTLKVLHLVSVTTGEMLNPEIYAQIKSEAGM